MQLNTHDANLHKMLDKWGKSSESEELARLQPYTKGGFLKKAKIHEGTRNFLDDSGKVSLMHAWEFKEEMDDCEVLIHFQTAELFLISHIEEQRRSNRSGPFQARIQPLSKTEALTNKLFRDTFPEFSLEVDGQHVIPVDADFNRTLDRASQLAFMKENLNMVTAYDLKNKTPRATGQRRLTQALESEELARKVHEEVLEAVKNEKGVLEKGVLWAIAIPKEIINKPDENFCFASGAFERFSNSNDTKELQKCSKSEMKKHAPVFQILNNALIQCPGARTVCCDQKRDVAYAKIAADILRKYESELSVKKET